MNALRKEREDENLSTADLVNNTKDVRDKGDITPRQAYAAGDPGREATSNPPDYIPPEGANPSRGPQPVPRQVPPAAPVAAVPAPASAPAPNPAPVGQSLSHAVQESSKPSQPVAIADHERSALFPDDELHNFRARWDQVQTSFVDEPRKAVESADSLVANVVKRLAEQFANEREKMEKQWDRGDSVNTEDLRQALRRYRSFFDRLLSA